jgi:anti-sigma factor ChrR (cupin superfamily)
MSKLANDLQVTPGDIPWKILREGAYIKLLRTCSVTGTWVVMLRNDPGTSVPPHKHNGPAEYYVMKGKVEVRGGVENGGSTACAGDYGYEPNGVIHEKTYFPELTEYLFINHGTLQYLDDDGNVLVVLDCQSIEALWEKAEIAVGL